MNPIELLKRAARLLPRSWRPQAKRLLALFANLACRASARPVGLALCYHRIDERTGNKATELVPALATADFERQVDHLAGRYRLVRASDLLEAARSRQRFERLPVAITFDDDAPTHRRFAAPILERIGATATFFINGASLEAAHEFWFERLQRGWEVGSIDAELLAGHGVSSVPGALSEIRGFAAAIQDLPAERRAALSEALAGAVGPAKADAGIRAGAVRELADRGFEIGFHTRRHDALTGLDEGGLRAALREGVDELAAAAGARPRAVSYPHGVADTRVGHEAAAAGFAFGFMAMGHPVRGADDPRLLDRVYPSPGSFGDFALDITLRMSRAPGS